MLLKRRLEHNMSQAGNNRVYGARDRFETARTVAALLSTQGYESNAVDVSTMVPLVVNQPQVNRDQNSRASAQISQVSLASIGQSMNRRQSGIGAYTTKKRKSYQVSSIHQIKAPPTILTCRAKLDSHADTCGVNDVALVVEYLGKKGEVHGFSKSLHAMQDIRIVKAAVAYDDPLTGEIYIVLIINQALYFRDQLGNMLLNPNQMRVHGLTVDDCPRHLSNGKSTHSITEDYFA
jgi:hypothetical protein